MDNKLFTKTRELERSLKKYLKTRGYEVGVITFGVTDIDPKYLATWITVKSDKEKKDLLKDPALKTEFKKILVDIGYPASALKELDYTVESQENVDRTYNGNWWYAMK